MEVTYLKPEKLEITKLNTLIVLLKKGTISSQQKKVLGKHFTEVLRHSKLEEFLNVNSSVFFYPQKEDSAIYKIVLINCDLNTNFQKFLKFHATEKNIGVLLLGNNDQIFTEKLIKDFYSTNYSYKASEKRGDVKNVYFFSTKNLTKIISQSVLTSTYVQTAKKLSDTPANLLTPKIFAQTAKALASKHNLKIQVLGEKEMTKLGMGGILSVTSGSNQEAQLIILELNPKAKKTVALVGKGITFDSGGISLKLAKTIYEMKHDMSGGAAVLATVLAASKLKIPYRVVGIIAASENLPSGNATKPGDVVTTLSGKTVEVLNTDAEGRMVLCDALTYVQKYYSPSAIIDIATLTSAMMVSLGSDITGVFGNSEKFNKQLLAAAKISNENFHFMPLHAKYKEDLKSKVADLPNVGKQRSDAIFAALFLQEFIENKTPWLHLDIAGTAWNNKGATGASIPTLINLLKNLKI